MKLRYKIALMLLCLAPVALTAQTKKWDAKRAQEGWGLPTWNIKTNLLEDLTTTMNLAVEFRTGGHTSIDIPVSWNPWSFKGGETMFQHIRVQPEFRYWLKETFRGHFFGLHAGWADYTVGGLWHGPFTEHMRDNRFDGSLAGVGVSWGHRWNFNRHWGLSTEIGVGYARLNHDQYTGGYACLGCNEGLGNKTKNYFGPTKLAVNLIFGMGAKKKEVPVAPAPIVPVKAEPYEPTFGMSFITPAAEPVKVRQELGKAYLEYHVGKSTVVPDFRNNAAELKQIHDLVDRVKDDEDITIKGIALTGHASPEGTATSNQSLSQRRAEALKTYLKGIYGMDDLMTTNGAGEDWTTLAELVGGSSIAGNSALLDIINGSDALDARERRLMAADGEAYKSIKAEMYPKLRRTDYVLDYEVAPITVERARAIILTNPSNLSLNEMFLVADSYPVGSEKAHEAHTIAARMHPESDIANLNAAASELYRKNAAAAARYLAKVKSHTAEWNNNMGILSAMEGDYTEAADYFRQAGSAATKNASELAKRVESLK